MPHAIYSGDGEYDGNSLLAVYNAYLPKLNTGVYEFNTGTVYNMSCSNYPNRILLFMRIKNAANYDLTTATYDGNTEETPNVLMFSLDSKFIEDIDGSCIPLNTTQDINVILFHDQYYDTEYVKDNIFCKSGSVWETAPEVEEEEEGALESPVIIVPKIGKIGGLKIKTKPSLAK
ncbi:MAG: hypothetical protein ACLGH8_00555 [Bacteroidia bacterium]|jgi:hypothetical protein